MVEYSNEQQTQLSDIEEQEKYLLHGKREITQVLLALSKRPDIITGYFSGGSQYILTAVIDVIADRNLVVFDLGPDEAQNRHLLHTGRMTCVAKHDLITIRFSVDNLQTARYQGQNAFAAPLPKELFRLQRREFFRVHLPRMNPVTCHYHHPELGELTFSVVDASIGGLGMLHDYGEFMPEFREVLRECRLIIPEAEDMVIDLEMRNGFPVNQRDGTTAHRIGCAFIQLTMAQNVLLQRYINRVQIEEKAREAAD